MNTFTHKTKGYENIPVFKALKNFFDSFLIERDFEKALSFLEDDFYALGIEEDSIVNNKVEFVNLLKSKMESLDGNLEYDIKSVFGKEIKEHVWNIMSEIAIIFQNKNNKKIVYMEKFSGCFRFSEKDFLITSMHVSENGRIVKEDDSQKEQSVFELISKAMPGGIISGYAEEGFPICFANDQYIKLLGYSSYDEYYKEAGGLGISHIHPDDINMVNKETMHSYSTNTQYGMEYRIRHKDGHYIHVYDIGKKVTTPDNREIIVCVLYDMTEDVKLKEVLMRESSYDFLTGVYNRGGGIRNIEKALKYIDAYSFAFFDIDNLKLLNDVYNHTVGDHALKYFAELLVENFDARTVLARFGGDEFVAFFRDRLDKERVEAKFAKLEKEYCEFIEQNYPDSHSSVSIGCVIGTKKCDFDELFRAADKLMYDIKKNGKKGFKVVELN